jgi:hypothetical protein
MTTTLAALKGAISTHNATQMCIPPGETKTKKRAIAALTKHGIAVPMTRKPAKPDKPKRQKKAKKPLSQDMHGGGHDPRIKKKRKVISSDERKAAWLRYYAGGWKKPTFKEHI